MGDLGPTSSSMEMQHWQGWGYQWEEAGAKQGVWNTLPTPDLSRGNLGFQKQNFSVLTHFGLFTRKSVWDVPGSGWHQLPWLRRSDTLQAAPSALAALCIQGGGGCQAEKLGFALSAHWEAEPCLHWARRVCWLHRFVWEQHTALQALLLRVCCSLINWAPRPREVLQGGAFVSLGKRGALDQSCFCSDSGTGCVTGLNHGISMVQGAKLSPRWMCGPRAPGWSWCV